MIRVLAALSVLLVVVAGDSDVVKNSVVKDGDNLKVVEGWADDALAFSTYRNAVNETGWAFLDLHTSDKIPNADQAYAAGFLEGTITASSMWMSYLNNGGNITLSPKLQSFMEQNHEWLEKQIEANQATDDYWHQIMLTDRQLVGMYDGYASQVPKEQQFGLEQLLLSNYGGDLETFAGVFGSGSNLGNDAGQDHCSALVKLLPGNQDIYISQVTWSSLNSMLRIYKRYDFAYSLVDGSGPMPGRDISFSSYPGVAFSGDDYYQLTSSGLVVLETTIGNSNPDLWKLLTPESVLEFYRNINANRLATSGKTWSDTFSKFNNGGYNNEFFVLDYNQFTPGQPLKPNTLWLLDQIPGHIHADDITSVLESQTYMPSYNLAYWPDIFNISGGWDNVNKMGPWFGYHTTPRAKIFKRNHTDVVDMDSMKALMRYNDFKHDPLAACDCKPFGGSGENGISCRSDLNPADGTYPFSTLGHRNHVGTDAKITSYALSKAGSSWVVSGPTNNPSVGIPVFKWSTSSYSDLPHFGMPDTFDFEFVKVDWEA